MESKAFMLILFSLTVALATESNSTVNRLIEATNTTPFAQCNPFNAKAKGITSCEEYFESSSLTFEACDLNLGWHDICVGAIPEEKGSLREICPTECATKALDPELEDDDAVAVENFINFLKKDDSKNGRRSPRSNAAGRRKLEAVAGYKAYPGYESGNLLAQFDDLDAEECANRCNTFGTHCAGFTMYNTRCTLNAAITLTQNGATETYVKIVAPECPIGYQSTSELNDIAGCGLTSCGDRYVYETPEECGQKCDEFEDCVSFTFAPPGGDRNHPTISVCTIYDSDEPTGMWYGPDDVLSQILCARETSGPCRHEDVVEVVHINHASQGTNGRYFYFSKNDWTTMAGSWSNGNHFFIDQWRDGVQIADNRQVKIWDNHNGVHGRYNPYGSAVNGDWQPGDIISIAGSCVGDNYVTGTHVGSGGLWDTPMGRRTL